MPYNDKTDFSQTKIYRVVCGETGEQYIGSTTKTLKQRLMSHESSFRTSDERKKRGGKSKYTSLFPILARGNYQIELVEEFACANSHEKHAREYYWMEHIEGGCVNIVRAPKGPNKARIIAYQKKWNAENKDKLMTYKNKWEEKNPLYQQEYYNENAEKKKAYANEYYNKNKEKTKLQRKVYAEAHKEKIAAYMKEWREKNKDKVDAKVKVNVVCECGKEVRKVKLKRHQTSKQHQEYSRGVLNSQTPVANTTPIT